MPKIAREYKKTVLDNGLRVVTEHIPSFRSVAVGVWVITGTRDESQALNGISHFVEHMVFKGTKTRNSFQIANALESVGGIINAFTSKEITCYYARILDEYLPLALDVLSDIMMNSLLNTKEMEKEKKVILEEINTMEDTPDDWIHDLYENSLFGNHPLAMTILGEREIIKNMRREHLVKYIADHYKGRRIIIAAAGNLKHRDVVKLVEKHFNFNAAAVREAKTAPAQLSKKVWMLKKDILQTNLCLGSTGLSQGHPDRYKLLVMNTILGSGMSSRLFQNIREKTGMAYSVYSYLDCYKDTGLFATYIATDPEKTGQAIELILKEYQRLISEKVPAGELEKCKSQLKGHLLLGLESTSNRMTHLAKSEIYAKRFITLDEIIKDINKVTANDVQRIAQTILDSRRLCLTILSPLAEGTFTENDLGYK